MRRGPLGCWASSTATTSSGACPPTSQGTRRTVPRVADRSIRCGALCAPCRYYYFECVELIRKFLICGLLRFVSPGSASQIVVGIIFCVACLAVYTYLTPYATDSDNLFSTVCQARADAVLRVHYAPPNRVRNPALIVCTQTPPHRLHLCTAHPVRGAARR